MKRFTRQIRLAEVGEAGQAKLLAASPVLVREGFAGEIERRYLEAAGVSRFETGARVTAPKDRLGLRHPEAIALGEGALQALITLKDLL